MIYDLLNLTAHEVCTHNLFTGSNVYIIYTFLIDANALQYFSWLKLTRVLLQQIPLRLANIPPLKTCNQSLRARFCTLQQVCSVDLVLLICVEWPVLSDVGLLHHLSVALLVSVVLRLLKQNGYILYTTGYCFSYCNEIHRTVYILIGHCEYHQ